METRDASFWCFGSLLNIQANSTVNITSVMEVQRFDSLVCKGVDYYCSCPVLYYISQFSVRHDLGVHNIVLDHLCVFVLLVI